MRAGERSTDQTPVAFGNRFQIVIHVVITLTERSAVNEVNSPALWFPLIGGLLALLCLWGGLHAARRKRLIDHLPTCKTTGVFVGLVEVSGTAEVEQPLISFLAGLPCVHYSWRVEEHWSRTVTETYTDSQGRAKTRRRTESGWKTIADGEEVTPFYLRDECGLVLIQPAGATLEPLEVFTRTCQRSDPLYFDKGPSAAISNSTHQRRFREVAIPLHAPIYVVGKAREREDVVAPEIAADPDSPIFLISTRQERHISRGLAWRFWLLMMLGFGLCSVGAGIGLKSFWNQTGQEWIPFAIGGGSFLMSAVACWVWMAYNSLVDLRNRVDSAWAQVDVQLKRRFDLIPRLEGIVKGLREHERDVQEELAVLRSQREATPPGVAGTDHHSVRGGLLALAESHPDLAAQPAFMAMQAQLTETEQRIALARGYFNEIATHFNTRLETIPDRFVAALGRMKRRTLMVADDFERAPVEVDLAA